MPSPATHQDMCVPFRPQTPQRQHYIAAVLAQLAYIHQEPELLNAMATYLGFNQLQRVQTPGKITVNFLVGAAPDGVVVAFSGTENFWQLVYYSLLSFNTASPNDFPFRLHAGFYEIWVDTQNLLMNAIPANCVGAPITLIGHSLGGAIALLWAYRFFSNFQFPVVNVVTFGSPAVGPTEFVEQFWPFTRLQTQMVRMQNDLVPFLPPNTSFAPRLGIPPLPILLFFQYHRIQLQLVLKSQTFSDYEAFPFNEWDWRRAGMLALILANPASLQSNRLLIEFANDLFKDHSLDNAYVPWLRNYMDHFGRSQGLEIPDAIVAQIAGLQFPTQDVTEIPPGTLDYLFRSSTPQPPNVTPNPLPPTFSGPETIQAGNAFTIQGPSLYRGTHFDPSITPYSARTPTGAASGGAISPAVFGEPQRPFWLFRGADRELLTKLQELFNAISARDSNVLSLQSAGDENSPPFIIDPSDAALTQAFQTIQSQADVLLSLQQQHV